MLKNKKGFTLVELLAVIVVLAIIALIGYTIVGDVISGAQESADKENVREYARSVRLAITSAQMNGQTIPSNLDRNWLTTNIKKTGNEVVCSSVKDNNGTVQLNGCEVIGGSNQKYCYDGSNVTTCTRTNDNIVKIYGTDTGAGTETINLLPNTVYDVNSYGEGYGRDSATVYKLPFIESGKTYTVSLNYNKTAGDSWYYLKWHNTTDGSGGNVETLVINSTANGRINHTFTAEGGREYYFYGNGVSYLNNALTDISQIQIQEANSATSYEPYGYKIPITAKDEKENEQTITVYIGTEKLGTNDYLSYDGSAWKIVRNGISADPIKVSIGSTGTDTMPTGQVTYSVEGLSENNFVYNYE